MADEQGDPQIDGASFSRVGQGIKWTSIGAVVMRIGQFLMGVVAAHLIAPEEFGAFAVALTVYGIVLTISDLGVTQAIIRDPHRTRAIGSTVQALNLAGSVAVAVALKLAARPLSILLGAEQATPAVQVLALTIIAGSLGTVPAMTLARDYRQRERFASDAANFVTASVTLVIFALAGMGAMALAWSRLAGQIISAAILNTVCRERYVPKLDRREVRPLLRFSLPLAGAGALATAIANVDTVTIARVAGAESLGYYNLAFNAASWPTSILMQVLMTIPLITLARSRHDPALLRMHMSSAMAALSAVALPVSALLIALAEPLVIAVYGAKWAVAAMPLRVLGFLTIVRLVQALMNDLLTALGLTRHLFLTQVVWLVALIPAMLVLVLQSGVTGAAWAHLAVGVVIVIPLYLVMAVRKTAIGLGWIQARLLIPLAGAIVCGIVGYLTAHLLAAPMLALVVGGLAGSLAYLAVCGRWLYRLFVDFRAVYSSAAGQDGAGRAAEA